MRCISDDVAVLSQQDCQEFLAMLLDTLHEDCVLQSHSQLSGKESQLNKSCDQPNQAGGNSVTDNDGERGSVITETFRGMLKNKAKF